MSSLTPVLAADRPYEDILSQLRQKLTQSGFRFMQTFDLHDIRLRVADCSCPYHGTSECSCQMIVLLVYREAIEPVTLVLHGHDGQTWISLANESSQHDDTAFQSTIRQILKTIPEK